MMKVKGILAIGLKHLRDQYEYYAMLKAIKEKSPSEQLDQSLAYTEYLGALLLLGKIFQVNEWFLDKLRANNDVILVMEGHYALIYRNEV